MSDNKPSGKEEAWLLFINMSNAKNEFGRKKYTQQEIADATGMSRQTISLWNRKMHNGLKPSWAEDTKA